MIHDPHPFVVQTAFDYDLPLHIVEQEYKKHGGTIAFYEALEAILLQRRNQI